MSTPHRGRPRSETARLAILQAADALLLAGGLEAVSMDAIAQLAGVSKATMYRWWPSKEALALDAVFHDWAGQALPAPDLGSLRDDLLALLRPWAELVRSQPYARLIGALVTRARTDDAFGAEYDRRLVQPRREQARPIFARAMQRGEMAADIDVEVAIDLLYGPLYHRLLHGHLPLDDAFVESLVELAVAGLLPR